MKKTSIFASLFLVMVGGAFAQNSDRYAEITDPKVVSINKEPARASFISYKDEEYAKKICKQIEDDGFQQYIRKVNIVAIYSKDMYSNIEDILESILNCKPIDYESVILKLK